MPQYLRHLVSLALALAIPSAAVAADRAPAVTGVVRDGSGVPQMGVLVELLGPGFALSTLTDLQGRYTLRSLAPGIYQLRASATLFAPALLRHLQVRPGAASVVNLTLSGLFDDTAWLPARPRIAGESPDDWKWTLRAPANRPMLRLAGDGTAQLAAGEGPAPAHERHLRFAVTGQAGSFGSAQTELTARMAQRGAAGEDQVFAQSVGLSPSQAPTVGVSALFATSGSQPTQRRTAASLRSLPQLTVLSAPGAASSSGLLVAEFGSAQRMELGDLAALEFGGRTELVRSNMSAVLARPFLRLTSSPLQGWIVSYALATTPSVQTFGDVTASPATLPTVAPARGGLVTDAGLHQEIRLRRSAGRARVQLSYAHDIQHRTTVAGLLLRQRANTDGFAGLEGLMLDTTSGVFHGLAQGFVSDGYSVTVDVPVSQAVSLIGGYMNASGLAQQAGVSVPAQLSVRRGQTLLFATEARLSRTGTRLTATYRLQPGAFVSVLNAYEAPETAPYLSVHLRQSVPAVLAFPAGTEFTVDCSNLLEQGYHSFPGDPSGALLASALREVRAGLAFSF